MQVGSEEVESKYMGGRLRVQAGSDSPRKAQTTEW